MTLVRYAVHLLASLGVVPKETAGTLLSDENKLLQSHAVNATSANESLEEGEEEGCWLVVSLFAVMNGG